MMDIVAMHPGTNELLSLCEAATRADAEGKTFRLAFGKSNDGMHWLKYKVGEGMWSAPMYSDHDYH